MSNTPKYDNDYVTLGYLKSSIKESDEKTNEKINEIPKNYNSPPVPPYYENSVLLLNGQIYKCIKSRLVGSFNMSDWSCVLDTVKYNELVVKSLDSVIDMLDVQQYDNKLETFLSNSDPASNWGTDLEKERHLYDFWKTYEDGASKTYIYNKFATNPITYGWTPRDCPEEIWDTTDGHKNLFGIKPTEYSKHDMWRIENDIDSEYLPDGCSPGEWAVCTKSNIEYDKSDWTNKLIYIDLDELSKRVYSKTEIDTQKEILEDEITTSITKSENNILAHVSQTYATQETTRYLADGLGEISDTVDVHTSSIADLRITVGQIQSEISDFADITASSEDYGSVIIENVAESEPVSIKIYPTNNQDISYLYPRINLYPSQTLFTKTRTLLFETNGFSYRYELPCDLLYYDDENYDEFEFDYNSQQIRVTKKVGVDDYGINYLLNEPYIITNFPFPTIELPAGDYTITLLGHTYAHIFVRCLISNIYTDQFPTHAQMKTAVTQTATSINQTVSLKVDKKEIISSINQTAEAYTIDASKINIKGVLTAINNDTSTTINGNKITTGSITANQIASNTITADKINAGAITSEKISSNAITTEKLATNSITAEKIVNGTITSKQVSSDIITTNNFSAQNINASKITSGILDASIVNVTNLNADNITSGTISADRLDTSKINAITGTIGGWNISNVQLQKTIGNYTFEIRTDRASNEPSLLVFDTSLNRYNWYVRPDGYMYARNCEISGNINGSSINGGTLNGTTITGGSININNYFSVNSNGGTQISTEGGGFFSTRVSKHPYMSVINLANGYNYGINFMSGDNQNSPGSIQSYIYQGYDSSHDVSYELNIYGKNGVEIASSSGAYMYAYSKVDIHAAGSSSVWASGNGLSGGRVKTDVGSASSRILKDNIIKFEEQDYDDAYQLLKHIDINYYTYKYNMYEDKNQYGFIIDDVEKYDNNKFFKFKQNYGVVDGQNIDTSIMDNDNFDENNLPENCIEYKEYNSDVLDKYMLTCLKALQNKIEKLEEKLCQ